MIDIESSLLIVILLYLQKLIIILMSTKLYTYTIVYRLELWKLHVY